LLRRTASLTGRQDAHSLERHSLVPLCALCHIERSCQVAYAEVKNRLRLFRHAGLTVAESLPMWRRPTAAAALVLCTY
jgi:hypothetical protein